MTEPPLNGRRPILKIEHARKSFGAVRALRGVSLSLHEREILALLGDNGAGKSTLVNAISGVLSLDEGEMELDGQPVSFHSPADARRHGIETVFQNLAVFDNLSARENFYMGRELVRAGWLGPLAPLRKAAMSREWTERMTALRVVIQSQEQAVGLMSGGQRQAVAVARAVAFASKIVILDEPTAALGVRESRQVLDLVKRLPEQGVSVILISHNLDHVSAVADRAVVLRQGHNVGAAVPTHENHQQLVSMIVGGGASDGQGPIPTGGGDR